MHNRYLVEALGELRLGARGGRGRIVAQNITLRSLRKMSGFLWFTNIHTEQLADWDGKESSPAFEKLVSDMRDVLGPPPEVGKTSEYDIPYYKTEWAGKVFQKGDRVRIVTWSGTAKPRETSHTNEVNAGPGQRGTIVQFH
jgi:hypothetical protein